MRKALFLILIIPIQLWSMIWTVDQSGSGNWLHIQEAVDVAASGDTVLVFPGEYFENIDIVEKDLSLLSTYIYNNLPETIEQTIIHGRPIDSAVMADGCNFIEINGFTIMNNYPDSSLVLSDISSVLPGGGIYLKSTCHTVVLDNCIIRNCIATAGGGIASDVHYLWLSNLNLYDNRALIGGGGINIASRDTNSEIIFDELNLCNIYHNTAPMGQDIRIFEALNLIEINIDTLSVQLTEADDFFIQKDHNHEVNAEFNILNGRYEPVNHDLYVSPYGDDSNSGLSPDNPLKTIAFANQYIASDSLNPKTIYLAEGTYSLTENGQLFPFAMKSYVNLIGDGMENTILDCEGLVYMVSIKNRKKVTIQNMNISRCNSDLLCPTISITTNSKDIKLINIRLDENNSDAARISISNCEDVIMENIIIEHTSTNRDDDVAISIAPTSKNIVLNNIIINDMHIVNNLYNYVGMRIFNSDVVMRNSIVSNCSAIDGGFFVYHNTAETSTENNLELSNFLFYNNECDYNSWSFSPFYIQNRYQRMQVNNCTFANNDSGYGTIVTIFGSADVRNSVFNNPWNYSDIYFYNVLDEIGEFDATMSNSLTSLEVRAENMDLITINNVLENSDPLFIGDVEVGWDEENADYYQLSENSPCIDSGTPDTLGLNIPPMDLAGNERVWNDIIDMGCYEYGAPPHVGNTECDIEKVNCKVSNYPNPVYLDNGRGTVFLEFTLPEKPTANPVIEIYNVKGQKVKRIELTQSLSGLARIAGLASRETQRGEAYSTVWDCRNERGKTVSSGVYFYTLSVSDEILGANKLLILK
jgi:hypothetical protein